MDAAPPPVQMIQLLAGFQVSQAIYVAAELGVADQLADGPLAVAELADRVQADPDALNRLLRSLSGLGVFTQPAPGRYGLTPLGRTLVSDEPGSMRDLARMWMQTHYAPFAGLLETVRHGGPAAERHYGMPFFQWLGGQPEQVHRFSRAMGNLTEGVKRGAVAGYDFGAPGCIVDVGGADGTLLAALLAERPAYTGLVFDLPHVIADGEATMKSFGLGERLRAEGGDFFDRVPAGGDIYLLSMILHDWDDDAAVRILANIAAAARPGTRVVSLELVLPPDDRPHMAKMIDLTMLAMLTGRERTEDDLRSLFGRAGLRYERAVGTPTPMSVVEATVR